MAIIASKDTPDMACPPFILASTAAALGYEVRVFFTFYGLQLLRRDLSDVRISPLADPAMPMPMPMPVLVAALPGMGQMTVDLFDFEKSDVIDEIEFGGAWTFLEFAGQSDVCLSV